MSNCPIAIFPMETGAELSKDTEEELVDATLNKQIVVSLIYLCNTIPYLCQSVGLARRFL
ncbi:hypothetical protein MTR_8g019120 [Medicago truncatula]|nr:hypothetical protein MTR_8g019120 [Medicago truncatula]